MTHFSKVRPGRVAMRTTLQTGLLTAAMALILGHAGAQQDNGQGAGGAQGVPGGGRQGRGQRGQNGGPGGNFGGGANFMAQMPFSMGTVTGGDPATGVIVVKSQFGGASQTIKASSDTKFVVMSEVKVSDLKVGDQVQIQGVPTRITANSISAGELPDVLTNSFGGRRNGGGGPGQPGQPGQQGGPNGGPNGQAQGGRQQVQAMASATGKITSKEPLTVTLSDEVSIVLKVSDSTKITKIMPATIKSIKLGDTILASGTTGQDGTFTATGVGINVNMGTMMGGMMGGRGMFGGGPGGFGGGPGGFGGGGGRRGGRGGAGGLRGGGGAVGE